MEDIQPKKNNSKLKYFLIAFDCVLLVILIVLLLNRLTLQKRIETLEKYAALPLTGELEYLYYDMPDSVGSTMILDDSITSNDLSSGIIDLSKLSAGMCSQGEILKKIDATTWGCAEDATVKGEGGGEVTGFVPGYGLILSESVLKVNSPICTGTNKLQWNGTAFVCSQDLDTNTQLSEVQVEGYIFDGDNVGTLSSGTLALDSLSFTGTLNDANIAALSSGVQGDILYHNGSNWTQLAAGTSGQFLRTQGAGVNPQWATVSGSISGGTVDDAILHWDSATSAWLENTNYLVDESGNVTSGTWQGTVVTDTYINDALTISSSGTVDWTALNNYPGACAAGNAVTQIGDILVCTAFWDSISDVPLATPSDGDTTHLSNADQIYDWVTGLGYLTTETDPSLATWTGSTNITILGTITTGTWNGTVIGDSYISDALTVNSSGTVDWTALNNYPGACAAGNAVTQIGD
ncbi:hypothetical protein JW766_05485, partial [Candidatus Dojkabacteria bacterium]|nr:hypothetical protein [Candidatus Dojkabacteria bacterium]